MDKRIKKLNHFVLGFVFNKTQNRVLLIEKRRPKWMAGRWNGIGGHIEPGETHHQAMIRESEEECGHSYLWQHKITFVCPGGTVFVYAAIYPSNSISFEQIEDEQLSVFYLHGLPDEIMNNVKWLIPLCLADVINPIMITQETLGTD